jgi:hypothetical protein
VFVNNDARAMQVVVPNDQLSLAIGKRGQNVRLAAKLTHWKIDIISENDADADTERLEALRLAELAFQSPRDKPVPEPEPQADQTQSVLSDIPPPISDGGETQENGVASEDTSTLEDDAVPGSTAEACAKHPHETTVESSAPVSLDDQPKSDQSEG